MDFKNFKKIITSLLHTERSSSHLEDLVGALERAPTHHSNSSTYAHPNPYPVSALSDTDPSHFIGQSTYPSLQSFRDHHTPASQVAGLVPSYEKHANSEVPNW